MTQPAEPDSAVARMRAARLEPLDPFVDPDQPWRCRCLTCGRVVAPRLSSIGAGGGCKYCATKGLDLNAPAVVFLLTNADLGAHVIGFDEADGDRTERLTRLGWQAFKSASAPSVEDAYETTAAVLRWLRLDLGLAPSASLAEEPDGPVNGSVAMDSIAAPEIWAQVSSELSRRRRRRRAAGGARGGR